MSFGGVIRFSLQEWLKFIKKRKGENMADNLERIGVIFTAEGLPDFKKSLSSVNSELNKNRAEFKLTQAAYDENTKVSQKLADKQEFLSKQYEAQSKRVSVLRFELEELEKAEKVNEKQLEAKRNALTNAEVSLIKYGKELETVSTEVKKGTANIEEFGKKVSAAGDKMKSAGEGLTRNVTAPILAIGAGAIVSWKQIDEAYDGIISKTGATGDAAEELQLVFDDIYGNFPFESLAVSDAIGEINTRLGFTGDKLKNSSVDFLKFAEINKIDVKSAIALVSRAMGDANIPAEEYGSLLDELTIASQKSGISIDRLTELITKYGAPMRALGFDTKESIAIMSTWEKAGVNTEIAFSGMKKAIGTWSEQGKDSRMEFKKTLEEIAKAPNIAVATTKAIEVFGQKAGPDLADAIQGGRFEYSSFLDLLENSKGTVENTFNATQDPADKATVAFNNLKLTMADLGAVILSSLEPVMVGLSNSLKSIKEWFDGLNPGMQQAIVVIGGIVAAIGPMLVIFGTLAGSLSNIIALFTSEIAVKALSAAGTGIMTAVTAIWNVVCGIATVVTTAFGAALAFLASPIGLVILAIVALIAVIVLFGDKIKEVMDKAWKWVNDILNKIKSAFSGTFLETFAVVIQIFQDMFNNVKKIFTGIIDLVKGVFTGNWTQAWEGVKSIFGGILGGLITMAKAPLNLIIGSMNSFINGLNTIIKGINSIKINMPDWLGGKSFGFNIGTIGKIPYLAKGGTLFEGMAMIAEAGPELLLQQGNKTRVLPLSNGGGATPTQIIDYDKLANAVVKAMRGVSVEMDGRVLGKVIDARVMKGAY